MVKIRLRRTGAKKQPNYRVVVADSRAPRDGRFIEIIGHYNPRTEPVTVKNQEDRALYWLSVGAQMTDPVERLLKNLGTLDRLTRYKEGTDLEELLAEAETAHQEQAKKTEAKAKEKEAKKQAKAKVEAEAEKAAAEAATQVEAAAEATAEAVEETADAEASEEADSEEASSEE
jgi:small subunit ribosomal protein S16